MLTDENSRNSACVTPCPSVYSLKSDFYHKSFISKSIASSVPLPMLACCISVLLVRQAPHLQSFLCAANMDRSLLSLPHSPLTEAQCAQSWGCFPCSRLRTPIPRVDRVTLQTPCWCSGRLVCPLDLSIPPHSPFLWGLCEPRALPFCLC